MIASLVYLACPSDKDHVMKKTPAIAIQFTLEFADIKSQHFTLNLFLHLGYMYSKERVKRILQNTCVSGGD